MCVGVCVCLCLYGVRVCMYACVSCGGSYTSTVVYRDGGDQKVYDACLSVSLSVSLSVRLSVCVVCACVWRFPCLCHLEE